MWKKKNSWRNSETQISEKRWRQWRLTIFLAQVCHLFLRHSHKPTSNLPTWANVAVWTRHKMRWSFIYKHGLSQFSEYLTLVCTFAGQTSYHTGCLMLNIYVLFQNLISDLCQKHNISMPDLEHTQDDIKEVAQETSENTVSDIYDRHGFVTLGAPPLSWRSVRGVVLGLGSRTAWGGRKAILQYRNLKVC